MSLQAMILLGIQHTTAQPTAEQPLHAALGGQGRSSTWTARQYQRVLLSSPHPDSGPQSGSGAGPDLSTMDFPLWKEHPAKPVPPPLKVKKSRHKVFSESHSVQGLQSLAYLGCAG